MGLSGYDKYSISFCLSIVTFGLFSEKRLQREQYTKKNLPVDMPTGRTRIPPPRWRVAARKGLNLKIEGERRLQRVIIQRSALNVPEFIGVPVVLRDAHELVAEID